MNVWKQYPIQVLIAIDQLINALIPPIDGTLSWADETLSARAHRMRVKGQPYWGWLARAINLLFFWQEDHCQGAWLDETRRRQLPDAYGRPGSGGAH